VQRVNFTLDSATLTLLEELAKKFYGGNKSQAVRAALESLAAHTGHAGWVISGYIPMTVQHATSCHTCHNVYRDGAVLYRPVFVRGEGPEALPEIPAEEWLSCVRCVSRA
jgi:hypothetical protein